MSVHSNASEGDVLHLLYGRIADEMERAQANGREADFSTLFATHPELREQLQEMIPTIQLVCRVGKQGIPDESDDRLDERQQLGDYRIVKEIGRGGMGVVYEARQLSLDRTVALKVLPMVAFLDERQLRRFKNEARAAASLQHPNIVRVHGVGCERSVHFYAMELIDGSDLAGVMRQIYQLRAEHDEPATATVQHSRPSTVDTQAIMELATQHSIAKHDFYRSVARIGAQAAEALQHAHDEGVIHRDIKPANLLLDRNGDVHVTDFGLAQVQTHDSVTLTGDVVGTMRYMSLEQIEGNGLVDARTDVYSLGLTLYELLTGIPAYPADSKAALLREIAECSPASLQKLLPDLPRDLATIVEKAMAKEADERYCNARELAEDLTAFLNLRSIQARPSTQWARLRRFTKRNRLLTVTLATTLASLALLTIVSSVLAFNFANQASREAKRVAAAQVIERKQRISLYARDMLAAQSLAENRQLIELQDKLLAWVPSPGEEDFRDFEWFHLWQHCDDAALIRVFNHELPMAQVEFIGNDRIATSGLASRAKIWSLLPEDVEALPDFLYLPSTYIDGLSYDAQANRVMAGDDSGNVRIWNLDAPVRQRTIFEAKVKADGGATNDVDYTQLNAQGTKLAVAGGSWEAGFVRVWELGSGETSSPVFTLSTASNASIAFDGHDDLVVGDLASQELSIYDSSTWERKYSVSLDADGVRSIDCDTHRAVAATVTYRIRGDEKSWRMELWHLPSWQKFWSRDVPSRPGEPYLSPDGTLLAWGDDTGTVWLADVNAETETVRSTLRRKLHPLRITNVSVSPNKKKLAASSTDGTVSVWDLGILGAPKGPTFDYPAEQFFASGTCFFGGTNDRIALGIRGQGLVEWHPQSARTQTLLPVADLSENMISVVSTPRSGLLAVGFGCWPQPKNEDAQSRLVFWNPSTNTKEEELVPSLGRCVTATSITADGHWFAASTHHRGVLILNRYTKQRICFDNLPTKTLKFTTDGETLVVGGNDGIARFLKAPEFEIESAVRLDDRLIDSIDISPDDRLVAAVGFDRKLVIYDRLTGQIRRSAKSFSSFPNFVRFAPDGKRLMTASLDGVVRLWMTETGEEVLSWARRPGSWASGEFSRDGSAFAIGGLGFASLLQSPRVSELKRLSASELRSQACQDVSHIQW